jgi:hypothetical protein
MLFAVCWVSLFALMLLCASTVSSRAVYCYGVGGCQLVVAWCRDYTVLGIVLALFAAQ